MVDYNRCFDCDRELYTIENLIVGGNEIAAIDNPSPLDLALSRVGSDLGRAETDGSYDIRVSFEDMMAILGSHARLEREILKLLDERL